MRFFSGLNSVLHEFPIKKNQIHWDWKETTPEL